MALSERFKAPTRGTPFHILSIEGFQKAGKLHLSATAPPIVAIQSTDFGTDGVLQKWPDHEERFLVGEYPINLNVLADAVQLSKTRAKKKGGGEDGADAEILRLAEEQGQRIREETLEPFKADYEELLKDPSIKTIVWDKATEVNEMIRLAYHGKMEKNPQIAYGPINAEFKGLVRRAAEHRKNLILIHDLTERYVNNQATGNYVLKGNTNVTKLVHSYVQIRKEVTKGKAKFITRIADSRFMPGVVGVEIVNADWLTLMAELMPEVDPDDWGCE